MPKRSYNISSLQRGLRILQLFAEASHGATARQLAERARLPESTVHRFLVNLEASNFLACGNDGIYHLGIACLALAHSAMGQLDIRQVSLPYLRRLNLQTRETIHLTARHGNTAIYVEKLDSPEPLGINSRIGVAVPLFCTAAGKLMLAYMPDEERRQLLSKVELKRFTPNTVGSVQQLEAELYRIRKQGYAYDVEEYEQHVRCIAAPIYDRDGSVNASVSLTAPGVRMPVARMRQLAPVVLAAANQISGELGHRRSTPRKAQLQPATHGDAPQIRTS